MREPQYSFAMPLIIIGIILLVLAFPLIVQMIAAIYFLASMMLSCVIAPLLGVSTWIYTRVVEMFNAISPFLVKILTPGIIVVAVVFAVAIVLDVIKKLFQRMKRSTKKR